MEIVKEIFKRIDLVADFNSNNRDVDVLDLFYINNPDGRPRWMWPSDLKLPIFLKFYSQDSRRSQILSLTIKLIFILRCQKLFFKKVSVSLPDAMTKFPIDLMNDKWALFTGTPGPNRKALFVKKEKTEYSFTKVSMNKKSANLLRSEEEALSSLEGRDLTSFTIPKIKSSSELYLQTTDVSGQSKRSLKLSSHHIFAVNELNNFSSVNQKISETEFWKNTSSYIENIAETKDERIPYGLITKLKELFIAIDSSQLIECTWAHGDFTPWNMYQKENGHLKIYDWELNEEMMPFGYDLFHFVCQRDILVNGYTWMKIKENLYDEISSQPINLLTHEKIGNYDLYLNLYLVYTIAKNLDLFIMQEIWHAQVDSLIQVWSQALTDILSPLVCHRSLMILDLFDHIKDWNYAAIKFPNVEPHKLNPYSDIDLAMERKDVLRVKKFINQHVLVPSIKSIKKSFMDTLSIRFEDGSLLSLDLLWKLKRKNLVLSSLKSTINSSKKNTFQVKLPSAIETARYIGLFYLSNNTKVPTKYENYVNELSKSSNDFDGILYKAISENEPNAVMKILNRNEHNRGLKSVINTVCYLKDSIKSATMNSGMVITFSGVDGAGKSTVINHVKEDLEKIHRSKVVVLRHRPSLFPILSAWTKGRVQAEREATHKLPRQGTNTSMISSILRYGYYYLDYFIGQFVVYYKHVLRGHIVLYDRYYFDFISDSRRSNITLPSFLTRFGYNFLLKPKNNYFLYAKPEIILDRKQELDRGAITLLTESYKSLFHSLGQSSSNSTYRAIENVDLGTTVTYILNDLKVQTK